MNDGDVKLQRRADALEVPKKTSADAAHLITRAAVASIPVVGGAALEIWNTLFQPPIVKRQANWMEAVATTLSDLAAADLVNLEQLGRSEAFATMVLQASRAAMSTHQREKLDALRNAVANAAMTPDSDETVRQLFVTVIERLTPQHLIALRFFARPKCHFNDHGEEPTLDWGTGFETLLKAAFPQTERAEQIWPMIVQDLQRDRLLTDGWLGMIPQERLATGFLTELGDEFLQFISGP